MDILAFLFLFLGSIMLVVIVLWFIITFDSETDIKEQKKFQSVFTEHGGKIIYLIKNEHGYPDCAFYEKAEAEEYLADVNRLEDDVKKLYTMEPVELI